MATHKLQFDEFEEDEYQLFAIHSTLEDFRLAYLINQNLPINLYKSKKDIQISVNEGETQFTRFVYEDEKNEMVWNLFQNKNEIIKYKKSRNQGLFTESNTGFAVKVYLLPELKKVDYFLKIENNTTINSNEIIEKINSINKITMIYSIDYENIKSKNNLIF